MAVINSDVFCSFRFIEFENGNHIILFEINMAENIQFKYQHIITAIFKFYKSETTKYI